MEEETRVFLIKIANTLFMFLFWMLLNSTIGIYFGYAFPKENLSIGNILFYIFLLASIFFLFWYYARLWKEKQDENSK